MNSQPIFDRNGTGLDRALAVVVAIALLSVSMTLLITPTTSSYEISVYQAFSTVFWALFALLFLSSIALILRSGLSGSKYWLFGIVAIAIGYALFQFLPLFRGYWLYGRGGSDVLAHIGFARTILKSGHATSTNNYPIVHLLMSELSLLLGISIRLTPYLLKTAFTAVYVFGTIGFAFSLTRDRREALFVGAFTIPFVFGTLLTSFGPSTLSFMLFPLLFAFFEQWTVGDSTTTVKMLAVGSGMLLVVFHPMTSVVLSLLILVTALPKYLLRSPWNRVKSSLYLSAIVGISFSTWHFSFEETARNISLVIYANLGIISKTTTVSGQLDAAQETSLTLVQVAVRFLELYGPIFLYAGLATVAVLFIAANAWRTTLSYTDTYLTVEFGAATAIATLFVFKYFIIGPERATKYLILFATLLLGVFVAQLTRKRYSGLVDERVQTAVLVIVLVLIAAMVPFAMQNSYKPHNHMTEAEHAGSEWVIEHEDGQTRVISQGISHKMVLYLRGGGRFFESGLFGQIAGDTIDDRFRLPANLGYDQNESIAAVVEGEPVYLVTQSHDVRFFRWYPRNQWEGKKLYDRADLDTLHQDEEVNKVYTNGGFDVWRVGR